MDKRIWKVEMKRKVGEVESVLLYELPADWSDLLDGMDECDEEHVQSIFAGVLQHLKKNFGNTGFQPYELIEPSV